VEPLLLPTPPIANPVAAGGTSDAPLRAIRALVLADAELRMSLAAMADRSQFLNALSAAADKAGIAHDAAALTALCQPDPLGIERWSPAPFESDVWPPAGFLPCRSLPGVNGPNFDWCWMGDQPLDQPFFEDSVRQAARRPLSRLLRDRTALDALVAGWEGEADPVTPAGLIFHMSRCGSTLVARMLQSLAGCYAASEPEPFDAVVQWASRGDVDDASGVRALRAVAAALGRNPASEGARFFIKLDCWHVAALPMIRAAFPATPWIFLTRDPLEVAVSQLAMPGHHVVPGMLGTDLLGIAGGEHMPRVEYVARVLGRLCSVAAEHQNEPMGMIVDYRDLSAALEDAIPRHFGISIDDTLRRHVETLSTVNSKRPGEAFVADTARKRAEASDDIIASVDAFARPAYARLMPSG
jgi:hypothetical protein